MDALETPGLIASLVSYDTSLNTFVVKLDDGSTRTVPAERVTRARARDRVQAQSNSADQAPRSQTTGAGLSVQSKSQSVACLSPEPQKLGRAQLVVES